MSGGSFDHAYLRVETFVDELMDRISNDSAHLMPATRDRAKQVASLAHLTAQLMKEAEYMYSGDTSEEAFVKRVDDLLSYLEGNGGL